MPRRDGTGPRGIGPMTGRGMGPCRAGYRPRMGLGYGRGMGRYVHYDNYAPVSLSSEEQRDILEDEKIILEEKLKEIEKRINTLEEDR